MYHLENLLEVLGYLKIDVHFLQCMGKITKIGVSQKSLASLHFSTEISEYCQTPVCEAKLLKY